MSTEYLAFTRYNQGVGMSEYVELCEHSSYVDLSVDGDPILRDMTGEEMVKLALKLLTVAGYVHGDDFVHKSIDANDPRRVVPWPERK